MKRITLLLKSAVADTLPLIWAMILTLSSGLTFAGEGPGFRPGGTNLRLKAGCTLGDLDSLIAQFSMVIDDSIPSWNTYMCSFPDSLAVEAVVDDLRASTCMMWVEPDYEMVPDSDDPLFPQQWHLENTGSSPWADIQATPAWAMQSGSCDIRVAVLDSGIPFDTASSSLTHEDLNNSSGGCDIVFGTTVIDSDFNDYRGHGTWVAGIVAARTNNQHGVAGVAYGATLVVYKTLFDLSDIAPAMSHAISDAGGNADVISGSWSLDSASFILRDRVEEAWLAGVVLTVSAGNRSRPGDDEPRYPCAFSEQFSNVLCVGGTMSDDSLWRYGGEGAYVYDEINISAPARSVFSTYIGSTGAEYATKSGTSASAPIVAGTAALVLSQARESGIELTAQQIRDIITESSDDCNWELHRGRDDSLGYGRVNAFKALLWTPGVKQLESDLIIEPSHYDTVSPYRLRGTLVVPDGLTLTIEPGTRIVFADSAELYVEGNIIAQGTEEEPIRLMADSGASWGGLAMYGGATGTLEHCEISGGTWVQMQSVADVTVRDCHIHDMVIGVDAYHVEDGTLICESNLIWDCALYGVRGSLSSGTFADNTIENCGRAGIYWMGDHPYTAEAPRFYRNEIASNGTGGTPIAGGYFNSTTAGLRCNVFNYNAPYQILCENGADIVMNGNYDSLGANILRSDITNVWCGSCRGYPPNCTCQYPPTGFGPLMWLASSVPQLAQGYNTFHFDNDGTFIFNSTNRCPPIGIMDITANHYEPYFPPAFGNKHFCPTDGYWDYDPQVDGVMCLPGEPLGLGGGEELFREAAAAEADGNASQASALYSQVVTQYPESDEAFWATRGYLRAGLASRVRPAQAHDSLLSVWNDASVPEGLRAAARREAVWALVAGQEWLAARSELEAIRVDTVATDDSLWATVALAVVDFLEEGRGGLDEAGPSAALSRERLDAFHARLQALMGRSPDVETPEPAPEQPHDGDLSVYPNPFNMNTEIRFDLPNAGRVSIQAYDILGRTVETISDALYPAGRHTVLWQCPTCASGVYWISMTGDGIHLVRKAVLLK